MEEKYGGIELTENFPSIEEILAEFDIIGNKLEKETAREKVDNALKRSMGLMTALLCLVHIIRHS